MKSRKAGTALSVKSRRLLREWGVDQARAAGVKVIPVGPIYRTVAGGDTTLVFTTDDAGRLCVGYALAGEDGWVVEEAEPYSARTLGYYQRRLRRMGARRGPVEDDTAEHG